ncbi:MAG: efflux RND transporter periplasmic adaptor subunit [Bacteroidales bacterium]
MNIETIQKSKLTLVFIGAALSALLSGCSSSDSNNENAISEKQKAESVRVMNVEKMEIDRKVEQTAHLQPYQEVYLASSSPGQIKTIHVEAGTKVTKGQVLVEMDKTQLKQAEIQLQSIEKDYHRMDTLKKVGGATQQQYDQIKTQYEVTKSNVEFLKENTRLVAPFSGTVANKFYEDGEMYSGAPNTQVGKSAILHIVQTNKLKAMVNVSERFFPSIEENMQVNITTDVYPGEVFTGSIKTVYPTVDPITRTVPLEITIPNPNKKLRPGMFARASVNLYKEEAFVVPSFAVMKLQGSNERYIFLEKDGKAHRLVVELGTRFDDKVEIISNGIKPGDKLIVAGHSRLLNGTPVNVQQ